MDIKQAVVEPLKKYWDVIKGQFKDLTEFTDDDAMDLVTNLFDSKDDDNRTFADLCEYCRNMYDGNQWQNLKGYSIPKEPNTVQAVYNYIFSVVEAYTAFLSATPPEFNVVCRSTGSSISKIARERAKFVEDLWYATLYDNNYETLLEEGARNGSKLGTTILQWGWDSLNKRPFIINVAVPENVRIGWASTDYKKMNWAIHGYRLALDEAKDRYPGLLDTLQATSESSLSTPHTSKSLATPGIELKDQTESDQVDNYDGWVKDEKGIVRNIVVVEDRPVKNDKMPKGFPDIPYIVIPNIVDPGRPWGIPDTQSVFDHQLEINERICDNADLMRQINFVKYAITNMPEAEPGDFEMGSRVYKLLEGQDIKAIEQPVSVWPFKDHIDRVMQMFSHQSLLPPQVFGASPGNIVTGAGISALFQGAISRVKTKQKRWNLAFGQLFKNINWLWSYYNPDAKEILKDGTYELEVVWPDMLPKDDAVHIQNVLNKLNAKAISLETAMNELGVKSPADEKDLIREERTDPTLFPAETMVTAQAMQAVASGPKADSEPKADAGVAAVQKQQAQAAPNKQVGTPGPTTMAGMGANAVNAGQEANG
jgi:hypothetical protein